MSDVVDELIVGGSAYSAGWESPRRVGVAVRAGRIVAVGDDDELHALAGTRTVVTDIGDGLLVPGFHDAHAHPVAAGVELLQCDLSSAETAEEALALIRSYAEGAPEEQWVLGGGWTMPHYPGGSPTRQLLDRIVPDRPVALQSRDHHSMWLNGVALELAGITASTPDPADGRIERDATGAPSGVLHEGAVGLLERVLPPVGAAFALRALRTAQDELFRYGIVGWQDAWVGRFAGIDDILDTYIAGIDAGVLRARVSAALWWERDRGQEQIAELVRKRSRVADLGRSDLLRAETVKIMVDGIVENQTAALSSPYLDRCGHATAHAGLTFLDPDALAEASVALDAADFRLHFHALGDRAVTLALDALERARERNGPRELRHHLAHLQVVQSSDVPRLRALGAAANLQMLWGAVDDQLAELVFPFLSPELVSRHYPFRELRDAGTALVAGSDWPVSSADPMEAIHVGVNRAEPGGRPDERMDASQAIDLATALDAYTAGSAAINGWGAESGRLRAGAFADLALLDRNPFESAPEDIHRATVTGTWVGGRRAL